MTQLKMPVYYYDSNGYKIGPINKKELFALAEKGIISPDTRITDDNIEVKAKSLLKLKFYAPEYHRAEELFNLENIDFDNNDSNNISLSIPQDATAIVQNQEHELKTITVNPINSNQIPTFAKLINNNIQSNKYLYFRETIQIYKIIIAFIWIGGLTLTIIATIVTATQILLLSPLVFIIGLSATSITKTKIGLTIDQLQWKIDTEEHLNAIKNRLNHND